MSTMLSTQNPDRAAELQGHGDQFHAGKMDEQAQRVSAAAAVAAAAAELAETGSIGEPGEGAIAEPEPEVSQAGMPEIGHWVHYQPRQGEGRRGRYRVPALVTWKYPGTRLLDLVVCYDANDTQDQQRIPEAVDDNRGWLTIAPPNASPSREVAELRAEVAYLKAAVGRLASLVMGEFDAPQTSILAMIDDMDSRLDALLAKQSGVQAAKPKAAAKAPAKPVKKAKRGK